MAKHRVVSFLPQVLVAHRDGEAAAAKA